MPATKPAGRIVTFRHASAFALVVGACALYTFGLRTFFAIYNCDDLSPGRIRGDCGSSGVTWVVEAVPAFLLGGGLSVALAWLSAPARYRWCFMLSIPVLVVVTLVVLTHLLMSTSYRRHTLVVPSWPVMASWCHEEVGRRGA